MNITKVVDKASPNLLSYCATGKHIPTAVLSVRKAGEAQQDYLVITLTDVLVSSVAQGGTTQDVPTESLSLNFAKVKVDYIPQEARGPVSQPVEFNWDILGSSIP